MNGVQQEIQHSRVMMVQRYISKAMSAAYELGKANAIQGYPVHDNPFQGYPVTGLQRAWENGWREAKRKGGAS